MDSQFNPYSLWLGLPTHISSPTYFEILQVAESSEDDEIRRNAAIVLSKVRSIRPGERAAEWAALIDEIRLAESCLLDPAKKKNYLAQIANDSRDNSESNRTFSVASGPASSLPPAPPANPQPENTTVETSPDIDNKSSATIEQGWPTTDSQHTVVSIDTDLSSRNNSGKKLIWALMLIVLAMLAIGVIYLVSDSQRMVELQKWVGLESGEIGDVAKSDRNEDSVPSSDVHAKSVSPKPASTDSQYEKSDASNGPIKKTPAGRDENDPPKQNKTKDPDDKNNSPGEKVTDSNDVGILFQFYAKFYLRCLFERRFDLAGEVSKRLLEIEMTPGEKSLHKKVVLVAERNEKFWQAVEAYASVVPGGKALQIEGVENPIGVVEADRDRVVFRVAGQNRKYTVRRLPNMIADAFAANQLGRTSTDYRVGRSVFLGLHEFENQIHREDCIRVFKSALSEASDVQSILDFFERDFPALHAYSMNKQLDRGALAENALPKVELRIQEILKKVNDRSALVNQEFIDDAIENLDEIESAARLRIAMNELASKGNATSFALLDFLEKRYVGYSKELVKSFVADFSAENASLGDIVSFGDWVMLIVRNDSYGWSFIDKRKMLNKVIRNAEKYDADDLLLRASNMLDGRD